jgi:hypothetical protein
MRWSPMQPVEIGDIVQSGRSGAIIGEVVQVATHYVGVDGKSHRYRLPMVTVRYENGVSTKPLSRWHLQRKGTSWKT